MGHPQNHGFGLPMLYFLGAPCLAPLFCCLFGVCSCALETWRHPQLVHFLVGMFHNHQTNPNNVQLVFTTHNTSILNQEVFRRDQIWFFEKNRDQSSHLYPLTDFHPRKDRENLLANYLDGRYGALPVFGELAAAFSPQPAWEK